MAFEAIPIFKFFFAESILHTHWETTFIETLLRNFDFPFAISFSL